ncbi:hypothetical protein MMC12_002285 [Toensbergia leucococca]|nr:hypothetical protein [Toensbergia leucococca]
MARLSSRNVVSDDETSAEPSPSRNTIPDPTQSIRKAKQPRMHNGLNTKNVILTPTRDSIPPGATKMKASASPSPERRHTTRAAVQGKKTVDYDMKHHPMDDMLRPKASAKRMVRFESTSPIRETIKTNSRKRKASPSPPERRHNTRAATQGEKTVDYDMKHHPMDDILRPKGAEKRLFKFETSSSPHETKPSVKSSKSSAINDRNNVLAKPTSSHWRELEPFDRRVFVLQKGAPLEGNTLAFEWEDLVEVLIGENLFTREKYIAWGGPEAFKSRYESVRLRIQDYFNANDEPLDEENWQPKYVENFDVYHLKRSTTRYWRRQSDSPSHSKSADRFKIEPIPETPNNSEIDEGAVHEVEGNHAVSGAKSNASSISSTTNNSTADTFQDDGIDSYPEDNLIEHLRRAMAGDVDVAMMSEREVGVLYDEHMSQDKVTDVVPGRAGSASSSRSDIPEAPQLQTEAILSGSDIEDDGSRALPTAKNEYSQSDTDGPHETATSSKDDDHDTESSVRSSSSTGKIGSVLDENLVAPPGVLRAAQRHLEKMENPPKMRTRKVAHSQPRFHVLEDRVDAPSPKNGRATSLGTDIPKENLYREGFLQRPNIVTAQRHMRRRPELATFMSPFAQNSQGQTVQVIIPRLESLFGPDPPLTITSPTIAPRLPFADLPTAINLQSVTDSSTMGAVLPHFRSQRVSRPTASDFMEI